jgi:hypothetical protein
MQAPYQDKEFPLEIRAARPRKGKSLRKEKPSTTGPNLDVFLT